MILYAGRVSDGAALVMRAFAESGATAAAPMREVALSEGALLHHLYIGLSEKVTPTCALFSCMPAFSSSL